MAQSGRGFLQPELRKSIRSAQGKENCEHKELAGNAKIAMYFCHTHSPWETDYKSAGIAASLNDRLRKMLDWKTA